MKGSAGRLGRASEGKCAMPECNVAEIPIVRLALAIASSIHGADNASKVDREDPARDPKCEPLKCIPLFRAGSTVR